MRDITAQGIIFLYIMKQREQTHTWYDSLSLIFFQLRQIKHSCQGMFLQVELHPRVTKRKLVMSILIQKIHHYLTC